MTEARRMAEPPSPRAHVRAFSAVRGSVARHLHRRIVVVFLGLLLLVQAAGFWTIRSGIEANGLRQINDDMRAGELLLRRLLAQNAERLQGAATLLAADYGFRAAIATGDAATLTDALANQAERIDAGIAVFTDPGGKPIASTLIDPRAMLARLAADARATPAERGDTGLQVQAGRLLQVVTVPVRAPMLVGRVVMGFTLNEAMTRDFHDLSSQNIAFLFRKPGGIWEPLHGTDASAVPADLAAALQGGHPVDRAEIGGASTALHVVSLARNDERELGAVLMRSIDEVVAPYRRLHVMLLGITLGGVLVFGIVGFVTARRITRPIDALAASAERLAAGDYAAPIPAGGEDEVGNLARSFEIMRVGIRQRDGEIRRLAFWDALTGLPNREQFRQLLREQLVAARRSAEPCSVVMLDIDRFKHVNDVLGHGFGDRLLACIGGRLMEGVRGKDTVARLGGDKFAICLPATGHAAAAELAQRLRGLLEQPLTLEEHTIDVSAGVGIASFPLHADEADALLGRAEVAMYTAKALQTGTSVYDPTHDSASDASLSMLSELKVAIDEEQLRLFLQPKFTLGSGAACGAEALIRWQHPQRGLLGPGQFIPFAERTGFIRELTGWMIEKSAQRCSALRARGLDLKVAVNLSTKDLMDLRLAERLEQTLSRTHLDPSALSLEITESAIMDDPQRALATLRRLDAMGVTLSIDDFGTGYSSLAYLKKLPLHELKIDRSFVMGMETDRADLKIVRSTVDLAHNLGYQVVAEGVETAQTWAILREMKCDMAQGFFIAKPMPEGDIEGWLGQWSSPQTRLRTEFAELI